jgi:hypothetical protein
MAFSSTAGQFTSVSGLPGRIIYKTAVNAKFAKKNEKAANYEENPRRPTNRARSHSPDGMPGDAHEYCLAARDARRYPYSLACRRPVSAVAINAAARGALFESLGSEHPNSNTVKGNYVALLQTMCKTDDEISVELASLTG